MFLKTKMRKSTIDKNTLGIMSAVFLEERKLAEVWDFD